MKITHYNNSFLEVEVSKTSILCDPWIGYAKENAWMSYPIHSDEGIKIIKKSNAKYVYISHLHCDHFSPDTIKFINKKKTKFIIKKFPDARLKNRLAGCGIEKKNIIELEDWEKFELSKYMSIAIIPQSQNNSSGISNEINYDLDTSILILDKKTNNLFFNNSDTPLSITNFKKIKRKALNIFKKNIDIMCLPIGAASEYPQCFLNISRNKERSRYNKIALTKVKTILDIVKPKIFFQAGGSYTICGKFSRLSNLIAQPNISEIKKKFSKKYNFYNIEGGGSIIADGDKDKIYEKNIAHNLKSDFINKYKNINYIYKNSNGTNLQTITKDFEEALLNYFNKIKRFNIKSGWKINLFLFKNIKLNKYNKINKKNYILKKQISHNIKAKKFTKLNCFFDIGLFKFLLNRKIPWNVAISGSYILFERKPNMFDPNVTFSLNFLTKTYKK